LASESFVLAAAASGCGAILGIGLNPAVLTFGIAIAALTAV
jgi:hypothetical protein